MESKERFTGSLGERLPGGTQEVGSSEAKRHKKKVRVVLRHRSQRRRNFLRRNFRMLTMSHAAESSRIAKTWMSLLHRGESLMTSV